MSLAKLLGFVSDNEWLQYMSNVQLSGIKSQEKIWNEMSPYQRVDSFNAANMQSGNYKHYQDNLQNPKNNNSK